MLSTAPVRENGGTLRACGTHAWSAGTTHEVRGVDKPVASGPVTPARQEDVRSTSQKTPCSKFLKELLDEDSFGLQPDIQEVKENGKCHPHTAHNFWQLILAEVVQTACKQLTHHRVGSKGLVSSRPLIKALFSRIFITFFWCPTLFSFFWTSGNADTSLQVLCVHARATSSWASSSQMSAASTPTGAGALESGFALHVFLPGLPRR